MKTIILKLVNAEEIIGRVVSSPTEDNPFYVLENCNSIQPAVQGDKVFPSLMPWIIGNPGGKVQIAAYNILTPVVVPDDLHNHYIDNTSTLKIARTPILKG